MKRKHKIILLVIVILILRKVCVGQIIKVAVKEPQYENFIMVCETRVTDFGWEMLDSATGKVIKYINVANDDELTDYSYEFYLGHNKYYLYGYFEKDSEGNEIYVYTDWDFAYPIKHGIYSVFGLSPKYVYKIEK